MHRFRPASLTDAPALARVHIASWRSAYRGLMPAALLEGLSEAAFTSNWQQRLAQMPRSTVLALADEQVVGLAAAGPSRDPDAVPERTGELYALYVHPESWNMGVGQRLWSEARNLLVGERFTEVTLWVLVGNRRARTFYQAVGFVQEPGAIKNVAREGFVLPEVRYRMLLT